MRLVRNLQYLVKSRQLCYNTWVPCLPCISSPDMSDTTGLPRLGVAVATDCLLQEHYVGQSEGQIFFPCIKNNFLTLMSKKYWENFCFSGTTSFINCCCTPYFPFFFKFCPHTLQKNIFKKCFYVTKYSKFFVLELNDAFFHSYSG